MKAIFNQLRYSLDLLILISLALMIFLPWQNWFDDSVQIARGSLGISWQHPLGTDALGRDQWRRSMDALSQTLPWLWLGVIVGIGSGLGLAVLSLSWRRTAIGSKVCRVLDFFISGVHGLPLMIAAFFAMVLFQGQGFLTLLACLGLLVLMHSYFFVVCNYKRSAKLGYWQAHAGIGGSETSRIWRYGVRGDWREELLTSAAFYMKLAIITEISLSYLGFGIQEPQASFGNLIASELRSFLSGDWALLIGVVLVIVVACEAPFAVLRCLKLRKQRLNTDRSQRSVAKAVGF